MVHKQYNYTSLLQYADKHGVNAAINLIACELGFIGFQFVAQLIYKSEFGNYVQLVNVLHQTFINEDTTNSTRIYADQLVDCFIRLHALSTLNLLQTNLK